MNERTLYNTKVEQIEKNGAKWRFKTTTLLHDRTEPKKLEQSWVSLPQSKCFFALTVTLRHLTLL